MRALGGMGEALSGTCSILKVGTEALPSIPPVPTLTDTSRTSSGPKDTEPQHLATALFLQSHFLRVIPKGRTLGALDTGYNLWP